MEEIDRISKIFKSLIKEKNVKLISHFDCDGIASASILIEALVREGINFQIKIIKQLTRQEMKNIEISDKDFLILLDLGSGQLNSLKDFLEKTQILIIDHHETIEFDHLNLFHLNPLVFNEDEIPSAIISYIFAKNIDLKNTDLIDLAVVGAIADAQDEKWEFKGLAKKILEEAETIGKITVTKGLRLYGRNIRPIHKTLELTFDPFIPGISGSESNAVQFLSELGISLREQDEWKKLKDVIHEIEVAGLKVTCVRGICYIPSHLTYHFPKFIQHAVILITARFEKFLSKYFPAIGYMIGIQGLKS